jgi:hypothetical protein
MRPRPGILLLALLATTTFVRADPKKHAASEPRGVVFLVDGVGGFETMVTAARVAFPLAGVQHELREFNWSHGWGHILRDLQDNPHLLRKGYELSEQIRKQKEAEPERPIYVVAKSGGTAIALAALEQLKPATVERVILLSAAVSPNYDLRPAFKATRGEIVSFHSVMDQIVLGIGTKRFGTADRVFGPSAGLRGFTPPPYPNDPEWEAYRRLVQIPWQPTMLLEGNPGLHVGTSLPTFLGAEVAPWLKARPPKRTSFFSNPSSWLEVLRISR